MKHGKEENTTAHGFVLRLKYGIYYCVFAADAIPQCHFQRRQIFVLGKGMLRAVLKKNSNKLFFYLRVQTTAEESCKALFPSLAKPMPQNRVKILPAVLVSSRAMGLVLQRANSYSCFPTLQLLISATPKTPAWERTTLGDLLVDVSLDLLCSAQEEGAQHMRCIRDVQLKF